MSKKAFRVESGVDAGGFNVSNVADPRTGQIQDAVNVNYFIRENTVQPFDQTRTYKTHFAVTYENRLWIAKTDIATGPFKYHEWQSIRTDPSWNIVTGTGSTDAGQNLLSGDYISAYSVNNELTFSLPGSPAVGDTIVIQDEGRYCHLKRIVVKAPAKTFADGSTENLFTIPGSMKTFVYSNIGGGRWIVHTSVNKIAARLISSTNVGQPNQLAAGDQVYRRSSTGHIVMQLPKYAADGDVVSTYDYEELTPVNGATIQVHPDSGHTIENSSTTEITTNTSDAGKFVYRAVDKRWIIWDGDNRSRWIPVTSDYQAQPMEQLAIVGTGAFTVTLPRAASNGDSIRLSNLYRNDGTTLTVKVDATSAHKILGDSSTFVYPKFDSLPKSISAYPTVTEIAFSTKELGSEVEFYFYKDGAHEVWLAAAIQYRQEHVDEKNRTRPGVAPLATQQEVNKNREDLPDDASIVTPKTLANKVSTETRRGIARLATVPELQIPTDQAQFTDLIVTPHTLNSRQSTEVIRGVAEVATQVEANTSTNDTHIITPKKLDARRASTTLAGIVKIAGTSAPGANRATAGTGAYDWSDAAHKEPFALTAKNLNDAQATETSRGVAYIATQSESNGQGSTAVDNVIVTPKKLDARRASETLAGVAEVATQAETNAGTLDTHIVTPKKLHARRATETLHGLAEIATQAEVNLGTDDERIITPLKFKGWLKLDHVHTETVSGINHADNLWDTLKFDIHEATETQRGTLRTATEAEAKAEGAAALDNVYITPHKLDLRRATETQTGITRIATQVETDAEAMSSVIVSPKKLADYIHKAASATATEAVNGTAKFAKMSECFVGNPTDGSTQAYDSYSHFPMVVSPRSMHFALQNYLPRTGKAFDSDKLDGLDSLQFLRRDKSDTMTGTLTVSQAVKSTLNHTSGYFTIAPFSSNYGRDYKCEIYFKENDNGNTTPNYGLVINAIDRTSSPSVSKDLNIWLNGRQVYHQGFRPTPAEIGAYTKAEADAKFVDAAGDTMTGDLSLPGVKFTGGNANKWRFFAHINGNIQFDNNNVAKWYMNQNGDLTTTGVLEGTAVKVGNFHVIETDGKIDFNKLKNVPAASTTQAGIVQLSNVLDEASVTKAATANTIKILKEMIDEKAGITGAIMNDLKIKNWIRIGNVILRPNAANKTLDFIWTDEPME